MDPVILETEALSLSPLERARLADKLLNSLSISNSDPVLESWVQLAEQRMIAYERGDSSALDGPVYLAEVRSRLTK